MALDWDFTTLNCEIIRLDNRIVTVHICKAEMMIEEGNLNFATRKVKKKKEKRRERGGVELFVLFYFFTTLPE